MVPDWRRPIARGVAPAPRPHYRRSNGGVNEGELSPIIPEIPEPPPETLRPAPRSIVRLAVVFYGVAFLAAALWRLGFRGEPLVFADSDAAARGVAWLRDGGIGVATGLAIVLLSDLATRRTRWGESLARALAEALGPLRLRDCLLLAGLSGVAEEAFFRGALQPELGLPVTSLLFGLAHLAPRRELLPWTAFAVAAGFILGGLYAATGNLVAPVVTHALVNGVNLRRLTRDLASG